MKKTITLIAMPFLTVASALAQTVASSGQINGTSLLNLIGLVQTIVARLVPLAIGLAVLAFFWYLIQFIWKGKEEAETKKISIAGMGWSIVAIFIMVSIWGLVGFLGSMLGIGAGGTAPVPGIPVPSN
ncbi:MAG: hypothetical protein RLZZ308_637 [Candidatus Parcubacteria bacterium]|jgi:uncharacterized membrane protein YuzA (DUF378 family)